MPTPDSENQPDRKRRRHLGAAATLSKPFRSPLRTRGSPSIPLSPPDMIRTPKYEFEPASTSSFNQRPESLITTRGLAAQGLPVQDRLVVTTRSVYSDGELLELQKTYRTLFSQRILQEKTLETARQALRINSSGTDVDLQALINKWRLISQRTAEEVFVGAKERVDRMGGMKAWRQRSKQDATRWDENQAQDQDQGYMCDEDMDKHPDSPDHLPEKDSLAMEAEDTEEEFTMEFMLKTLNVETRTIGLDAVLGKWNRK